MLGEDLVIKESGFICDLYDNGLLKYQLCVTNNGKKKQEFAIPIRLFISISFLDNRNKPICTREEDTKGPLSCDQYDQIGLKYLEGRFKHQQGESKDLEGSSLPEEIQKILNL